MKNCIGRKKANAWIRKLVVITFWLLVWQILAWCIDNSILLESPIGVGMRLLEDLQKAAYYQTVFVSVLRMMSGMILGVLTAVFCSVFSWKNVLVEELLEPVVHFLKAAPIACFIVLLLIWTGADNVSFYVSFLVAYPPVYLNFLEGLKNVPSGLKEVAKVFGMPLKNCMKYIYLPCVEPYFMSALKLTVGMSFKAGVAAEIIGTPDFSMGERIYMSKIYLDTEGVLSWMLTVILVSYLCEKVLLFLVQILWNKGITYSTLKKQDVSDGEDISLQNVTVKLGDKNVLDNVSALFENGKIYCVMGASGLGKTTLLRTLSGLQKITDGKIEGKNRQNAMVFQEGRLFEEYTAAENILATGQCAYSETKLNEILQEILPQDELNKMVKEFSGGMKRRVEIARAVLSCGKNIFMDEPFNGLDPETKRKTAEFIKKYQNGRTIVFASHFTEDAELMNGEEVKLWKDV